MSGAATELVGGLVPQVVPHGKWNIRLLSAHALLIEVPLMQLLPRLEQLAAGLEDGIVHPLEPRLLRLSLRVHEGVGRQEPRLHTPRLVIRFRALRDVLDHWL